MVRMWVSWDIRSAPVYCICLVPLRIYICDCEEIGLHSDSSACEGHSERLVDMRNHNYSKETGVEPNLTFTPDGKWLIFSGNFHSNPGPGRRATTHAYAVELAKPAKKS